MTQRRTIGDILVGLGRITDADVAKALEYQRRSGGYFGEALVACGLVTKDAIDWGLASQFDLPYVFPKADEIDTEAAAMVSPEWALANLTLPIMRSATSLTVIVESPTKTQAAESLRARTDLEIGLALASRSTIRELIRQVYTRAGSADEEAPRPIGIADALDLAVASAAARFGVSARRSQAWVWWDEAGSVRRCPLSGDWRAELNQAVRPALPEAPRGPARLAWKGELARSGPVTTVNADLLTDESGCEYLFRLHPVAATAKVDYRSLADGIVSEVRLLARSGAARFVVTATPPELGRELLPRLPTMLLDPSWRSIYVHSEDRKGATEAFSRRLPLDRGGWRAEIESLRTFQFDAVTLDVDSGETDWLASALDHRTVTFLLSADGADVGSAFDAGFRWHLHVARRNDAELDWSLEPLLA
jgi:type IV pilus assembly protein PilB